MQRGSPLQLRPSLIVTFIFCAIQIHLLTYLLSYSLRCILQADISAALRTEEEGGEVSYHRLPCFILALYLHLVTPCSLLGDADR